VGKYNFSEKPYACVALDSGVELNTQTLNDPEIRKIIDLAKWMGIDEVRFFHKDIAQNTIIGKAKYVSVQKVTSIVFEFPQTSYSDGMTEKDYDVVIKEEIYLSAGTLAKAMLYFNGLARDEYNTDLSLAIQLQFIAGNSIPRENIEEPSIVYIAPYEGITIPEDSPNYRYYTSSGVNIVERIFDIQNKIV